MKTRILQNVETKKSAQFTVYLPVELDQWLRDMAIQERRTLTQQTTLVLEAGRNSLQRKRARRN